MIQLNSRVFKITMWLNRRTPELPWVTIYLGWSLEPFSVCDSVFIRISVWAMGSIISSERSIYNINRLFLISCNTKLSDGLTSYPGASYKEIQQKTAMRQAEQDPNLPHKTLTCKFCFGQCPISPLFNRVVGHVKVPAGQVNSRGSLPRIMFCNLCCTLYRFP